MSEMPSGRELERCGRTGAAEKIALFGKASGPAPLNGQTAWQIDAGYRSYKMITANTVFLTIFLILGIALLASIQSYRFATYRIALARGRRVAPVLRPFWMRARGAL